MPTNYYRYCQRIEHSNFWGGESELLVLSKLCCQPVIVYIPEHEHTRGVWSSGFIPIAEYGTEFTKSSKKGKARKPSHHEGEIVAVCRCRLPLEFLPAVDTVLFCAAACCAAAAACCAAAAACCAAAAACCAAVATATSAVA
ncbi:hypothetical protein EJ110_NYTH00107 [Nymphaea thermarum]|nr:hypothetical protein EJ110_NYTH00107 [Nymphaea thermarum]